MINAFCHYNESARHCLQRVCVAVGESVKELGQSALLSPACLIKQIFWQNEPDIYTHVHENQASASLLKAFLVLFVYKCLKRIASMNCRFITSTCIDNFLPKLYFVNRGKEPVTFVKCDPENSTASGKGASEDDVASYAVWPSNFQPRVPILGDLIVQNYSHRHKTPLWWKKC